jgi:2-haloacid dehalogenase
MQTHTNNRPVFVFDFGGVLIDWNPRYLYRKLFNGEESAVENFLAEIDFFTWNQQQDAGRPVSAGVEELCRRFPQHCRMIQAYDTRYPESLGGAIEPTVDILRQLKKQGDTLYALSNWPAEKYQLVRDRFPFFEWFDDIIISGQVRLAKPDPRIFELLVKRIGRPPGECLFIDDSPINIEVTQSLGLMTIHFTSPERLQCELVGLGLIEAGTTQP